MARKDGGYKESEELRSSKQINSGGLFSNRRSRVSLGLLSLGILVAGTVLGLTAGWFSPRRSSPQPRQLGDRWLIPIVALPEGVARHFEHAAADGTKVRFFVLRSPDGAIRAALDACEVCWREGKGYLQEGDHMVCRNCGRRFALQRIGEYRGGCNPHPLAPRIQGEDAVLQIQEIEEGARYFRFGSGGRS